MQLFRRYFGARDTVTGAASLTSQDKTNKIKKINDSPPPSYEDSQDASLRAVLQGAKAVMPLLWPSAAIHSSSPSSSALSDESHGFTLNKDSHSDKEKEKTGNISPSLGAEESAIMEVLEALAMTACGEYPFLDRVRQFSDFYFTPYTASEAVLSSHEDDDELDSPTSPDMQTAIPIQELQRIALHNLNAPRESAALVLCARVLEEYYATLGHADSTSTANPGIPPESITEKGAYTSSAGGDSDETPTSPTPTPPTPTPKTRLTQITACAEPGCACGDFDELPPPNPTTTTNTSTYTIAPARRCTCGHARILHSASPAGLSRLLRRYTNWHPGSYTSLNHRSTRGSSKHQIKEIEVCRAPGANCACPDYDKGRRTGRCARCGHYYDDHFPILAVQELQASVERRGKKRDNKDGKGAAVPAQRKAAEWELSWILVENAYSLLSKMIPSS
ncbi:hypothetical protein GGR51DRAFT_542210 [Nemania sp. FL0031]|nr:hypothetical protein GGR51DRAFT_542210 [Nemania sp. FL0031]